MHRIAQRTFICLALVLILLAGTLIFVWRFITEGEEWAAYFGTESIYHNGSPASGTILDIHGAFLADANEEGWRYSNNFITRCSTLHAVGDAAGRIGTGAIHRYGNKLNGYNLLTGSRSLFNEKRQIWLTIDAELCRTAYEAMNGRHGCVGVYNYKTGEILCMVSTPTFDPLRPEAVRENDPAYDGVYFNRLLSSTLIPGSTFKLVTVEAAFEEIDGILQREFVCTGSVEMEGSTVTCPAAHGTMNLQQALASSCNCVIGQLAVELGPDVMQKYAEKSGLTDIYHVDGIATAASSFDFYTEDGYLAWSGVGQGKDEVNPCALMVYAGAIANGGRAAMPHLISKITTEGGVRVSLYHNRLTDRLLSKDAAAYLNQAMRDAVTLNYGTEHFPGMRIGAKTGTAQSDTSNANNAWFVGFNDDPNCPLAFVVYLEGGGSGASQAMYVASRVMQAAVQREY